MISGISIFDVDRTLTRQPTYSAFLLFGAWRTAPWRLLLLPLLLPFAVAYAARLLPRKRMKEMMHRLALGRGLDRRRATSLAEAFAARLAESGLYPEARETIEAERKEGRLIVLATAAPELYIAPLARIIGADAVLASRTSWDGDRLVPTIGGENCYGPSKLAMISVWVRGKNYTRDQIHVRFFSDHASDLPTFEWADEAIIVNPSAKLLRIGNARGWKHLDWIGRGG